MSLRKKALLGLIFVALLWGSAGTVTKLLLREANPFVIIFYRFLAATLIMLPFFIRAKKPRRWFLELLPLGLFNAGNVLFYYMGLLFTTANTGSLLGAGTPILTAVLSYLLIGEPIARKKLMGILIGLIGALLIILTPILEKGHGIGTSMTGNLLMLGSTLSWTLYIIRSRASAGKLTFNPVVATFVNFLTCTIAAFLFILATKTPLTFPALFHPEYASLFLYVVLGITVTTFFVFQWSVQHVSATTASLKDYLQVLVGVSLNTLVLQEKFTFVFFLGGALILSGMLVATGEQISRKLFSLFGARTT